MIQETEIGRENEFPTTHWSVFCQSRQSEALEQLAQRYWKPLYFFLRKAYHCEPDQAREWLQELFWLLLNRPEILEKPCPEKGRFRSYLIGILKNIKRQEEHKKRRTALFSLEIILESQEEAEIQASPLTAEELFHQEWAKQTVYLALKQMESEYKNSTEKPERQKALKAFKQHFLEEKPIQEIAQELQCPAPWVSEKIYRLKKKYRNALQQIVQDTLFPGENIEEELADLLHLLAKK